MKYSTPEAHAKFKLGVETLQDALTAAGFRPKSTDLLTSVPGSAVDEFWVAPWMLSFDPNVSVKGVPSKKRLLCFGLRLATKQSVFAIVLSCDAHPKTSSPIAQPDGIVHCATEWRCGIPSGLAIAP